MTGIVFPNVANALLPLMQMDRQAESDRLSRERLDKHDQWMMEDRKQARELQQMQFMEKLDATQRAKMKEAAEYTAGTGMAILGASPEQRPQMYAMALQDAQARGFDTKAWPQQWSPQTESWLHFNVRKAQPIADYFKQEAERPTPMAPMGGAPGAPAAPGDVLGRAGTAISGIESGGKYDALGPMTGGDRAYGKYQVMGANVPSWTAEVLGKPMTPQEFIANPQAQDAVFKAKFGQYVQKYGPEGASRAWFAGEGGMNNPGAADVNGMTVAKYAQKFNAGFGGPQPAMGTPPPSMVAQGANAAPMPSVTPQQVGAVPGTPANMPGGFSPTNTPAQSIPGGLPQVAQGDAIAAEGVAPPRAAPADPVLELRSWVHQQFPGAAPYRDKSGNPVVDPHSGLLRVRMPNGQDAYVRPPPKKEESGPFAGTGMDQQAHRIVLEGMKTGSTDTPEYAAALAHLGAERILQDPTTGQITRIKPDISWATPSRFAGGAVPQPATPPVPGAKSVVVEPGKGKPLDNSRRDEIRKQAEPASALLRLTESFDPSYAGYTTESLGNASNFAKRNLPEWAGGEDPNKGGQAQWWQDYANFANLERNKLFGAALSTGEQAAWKEAMVNPGMRPDQIKANLTRQRDLAQKALSRIANGAVASGHNKEEIEMTIGRRLGELPDPMGDVPHAKPGVAPPPAAQQQFDLKKKYGLE